MAFSFDSDMIDECKAPDNNGVLMEVLASEWRCGRGAVWVSTGFVLA